MAKRFYKFFPWIFVLGEIIVVSFALLITLGVIKYFGIIHFINHTIYPVFIMVWLVISVLRKDYKIGRTTEAMQTLQQLVGSLIWFLAIMSLIWMPFKTDQARIIFLGSLAFFLFFSLGIYRVWIQLLLKQNRVRGNNYRNAVILGKGGSSTKLAEILLARKDYGINFLGFFDDHHTCTQTRGTLGEFFKEAVNMEVDLIYVSESLDVATLKNILNFADENYYKAKIIPEGSLQLEKNLTFSKYGDFFVINVNEIPLDTLVNRFLKRGFDIVFSLFVTVFILSWLIPLVGLLIKLESKGPVFFIQDRNGVNNKVFKCLKFRSMTPNDYSDTHQAIKSDPRVTRIGSFLRASSIDEMPQFLNVLRGEMSVVGPRPHTVKMNQMFKSKIEKYNSRHKIKPGITGLAQIKGYRGEIKNPHQIRSRVKLDYFYIQNWSLWMDLGICVKTVVELVKNRENAY